MNRSWLPHDHVRHEMLHNILTQHIQESLQVWPGPFLDILGGAWGRG